MRLISLAAVVALLGMALAAGCGGGTGPPESPPRAAEIQDGAEKYDPPQISCPVGGQQPISGDYHAEVEGKRIYFDSQKCEEKFKQTPKKHLEDYTSYRESMQQAPEMQ